MQAVPSDTKLLRIYFPEIFLILEEFCTLELSRQEDFLKESSVTFLDFFN